jgi:putative transposase
VSQQDWDDVGLIDAALAIHADDPGLEYRFITDELADAGIVASENRVWRLCWAPGVVAATYEIQGSLKVDERS